MPEQSKSKKEFPPREKNCRNTEFASISETIQNIFGQKQYSYYNKTIKQN